MVRIYSSVSHAGGSTTAFINLTNALNEVGCSTVFYGPHSWHLDKCKSVLATEKKIYFEQDDVLIIHLISVFRERPDVKKIIFSSHEQDIFPLNKIQYDVFDKIHYVSEHQRKFHNVRHPYFILPNILDELKVNKVDGKIGGIISSIDKNKQVHVSIQRALDDGCEKVLIFGNISEQWYWQDFVSPLVDGVRVVHMGFQDDKQKMYDSFTDLYFSSIRECAPYVLGEAKMAGKKIHTLEGKNYLNVEYEFDKNKIVKSWIKEIGL